MKRLAALFLVLALSLPGAACAELGLPKFFNATIDNPAGPVDIYRVKNTYAAALQLVADYRDYCWAKPYAVLMADPVSKPVCQNRRVVVRFAQAAKVKARTAINLAEDFITNNPRLSAVTVIDAAWKAVTAFRSAVPAPL